MKRYLALVPLAVFLIAAPGGCKDPYGAAVKAGADIAEGISKGMTTIDSLRVDGLISPQEESNVLGYLKFVNDGDGAFLTCVDTVHKASSKVGAYTACAQTFASTLNNPQELGLIHVSNANASITIKSIVDGVATGINAVIAGLGGK